MTQSQRIRFEGHAGDTLSARLDMPVGRPPRAFALFAHCFTCGKDIFAASRIASALVAHGIGVLRFDFTGLGMSKGEFANTNFSSNVADLVRAASWLSENHASPQILIGHSLGGAAVIAAAPKIDGVRAVVTIGAPASPGHVEHLFEGSVEDIAAEGVANVSIGGRPFPISKQFLEDIRQTSLTDTTRNLNCAIAVFHSPIDNIVGIDNAAQIYGAAKHPKSFISLDTADHLLRTKSDAIYVADVIGAWASRYLDPEPEPAAPPEGEVHVFETQESKFTQSVRVGRHHLVADEPTSVGGADLGPNPYDFLLTALGACTTMTMRMYAEHKGFEADRFGVRLRHEKIYAKDCEDCESDRGKIDQITREIVIEGVDDPEIREKFLKIADRCPVHRTLEGEIKVRTRLLEETGA